MFFDVHTHSADKSSNCIYNLQKEEVAHGWFSTGIHPWIADQFADNIEWLKSVSNDPKCVAIGEAGLDNLKGPELKVQEIAFLSQIELSESLQLPMIIHCVKAWNELRVIRRNLCPTQPWIYHGFAKTTIATEVLKEGMIISIGSCLVSSESLQDCIKNIPLDQLLLETDDSFTPIEVLYEKVSELKNIPLSLLEQEIEQTVKRTFKKWTIG